MAIFLIFDENDSFIDIVDDKFEDLEVYKDAHPSATLKQSKDFESEYLLEDEEELDENLP